MIQKNLSRTQCRQNLSLLNTVSPGDALDEVYSSQTFRNIMKEHHTILQELSLQVKLKAWFKILLL